jgi:hypothetical protein
MGLFSYTIANHAANSEISRASDPGQSEMIKGISGQILTPGVVFSKSDTSEIQSLAYNPVPTLARYEALPNRRTLPSGKRMFPKISRESLQRSDREASSIRTILRQELPLPSMLAMKFWSEKKIVTGFFPKMECSVLQVTHKSLLGSNDTLRDWLTVVAPSLILEP